MLFFNYSVDAPYMHYGVVDRHGELVTYIDIPLPGPRLPHDMAFTENWSILNDLPLYWDPKALADGYYSNTFNRDIPSRFALVAPPRHHRRHRVVRSRSDLRAPLDQRVRGRRRGGARRLLPAHPTARGVPRFGGAHKGFETLDMNVLEARHHRWRFNLATGACTEEPLSDRCAEFPMINGRHGGCPYRYSYQARCAHGLFAFDGLIKYDAVEGTEELLTFDEGVFVSETVMAPRGRFDGGGRRLPRHLCQRHRQRRVRLLHRRRRPGRRRTDRQDTSARADLVRYPLHLGPCLRSGGRTTGMRNDLVQPLVNTWLAHAESKTPWIDPSLAEGATFPAAQYADPSHLAREQERLFARLPQAVALTAGCARDRLLRHP